MNRDFDRLRTPLRIVRAQRAAALLAGLGAAIVQVGWLEIGRLRTATGGPLAAGLLLAVTAYLVSSLWFFVTPLRGRRRLAALWLGLASDLILASAISVTLFRGHESGVLRLGLWIVPPTLLAFCALAAVLSLLVKRDANPRGPVRNRRLDLGFATWRLAWTRVACALVVLILLLVLEATAR